MLLKDIVLKLVGEKEIDENWLMSAAMCRCYKALEEIKAVLEDDAPDDKECFKKIEAIVHIYEELGSGCGNRHDFG